MQETEMVPVSLVQQSHTSDTTACTPGSSRSLTSLPNSSHSSQNPVTTDIDLKDEYSLFTGIFAYSQDIFPDSYIEYEQGQKEILVKASWKINLRFGKILELTDSF